MALREKQVPLSTITPTNALLGQKLYSPLINNVRTFWIALTARATLTLAGGPATVIKNAGSLWAAFSAVGLEEAGVEKVNLDGRLMRAVSQINAGQSLGATRLTLLANGAYSLEETIYINFSSPTQAGPAESVFMERDPRQALQVFVQYLGDNAIPFLATTPGTAVLSNVSVTISQMTDDLRANRTKLIPFIRQITQSVPAANTDLALYLRTSRYLQGLVIQQDAVGAGEVTDIINSLALRGDFYDLIGPKKIAFNDLRLSRQQEFGADPGAAYVALNFRRGGRLSNIVNPAKDTNFRIELDCKPSASGTSSLVRVAMLELERVPGLTDDTLPFTI